MFTSTGSSPSDGTTAVTFTVADGKTVSGYLVEDDVCLAAGTCATDLEFILALSQTNTYTNAGLVGLAPYVGGLQPLLLVNGLTSLTDPLFAFLIDGEVTTLDFGDVVDAAMEDPTKLTYLTSTEGNDYWSNEITQVRTRVGEDDLSVQYVFEAIEAKVTLDQECIWLPQSIFN